MVPHRDGKVPLGRRASHTNPAWDYDASYPVPQPSPPTGNVPEQLAKKNRLHVPVEEIRGNARSNLTVTLLHQA